MGVLSTVGMFSIVGGGGGGGRDHDKCRGNVEFHGDTMSTVEDYFEYRGRMFSTVRDIIIHVGDIMSTVGESFVI